MNSTVTRMEFRPVIDAVRGEFFFVGEGRRMDSRLPWPGAGSSCSGISPPRRRRKGLPIQTASANMRGLMNSTATRMECRPVIDAVRGEFFCVGEGRRVDTRSPWAGAGGSCSRISAPSRRGKGLPIQTASASLGDLAWVPFVHGVSTEALTARLPGKVHGRDRSLEFFDSRRPRTTVVAFPSFGASGNPPTPPNRTQTEREALTLRRTITQACRHRNRRRTARRQE